MNFFCFPAFSLIQYHLLQELFCPLKLWGIHVRRAFLLQQHLSRRLIPAGRASPDSHPWALLHSGWCYRSVQTSTVSFFESHNDQIAVQKIKHYTNICINNLFECISSPLIDHVYLYDTWSVMVFQILPFSILTATVLHVDILSIPKAEASTTFPKAPWPRVLPSKGKRHLISGRVSELSVPQAEISLSVRQCN